MVTQLAIVGTGPRGLCVLERLLAHWRHRPEPLVLHLYDPQEDVGVGIHQLDQPDYLLLNTVCSQLTAFSDPAMLEPGAPTTEGPDLFEWARDRAVTVATSAGPRPVRFDDFLPRRLLGEYLRWAGQWMLSHLPSGVIVHRHREVVQAVDPLGPDSVAVLTAGERRVVDLAVVTTGHGLGSAAPPSDGCYPLPGRLEKIEPGSSVALLGTGLTAMDVLAALTVGRGGSFAEDGQGGLRYLPSGAEPAVVLVNREGWLPCARPAITAAVRLPALTLLSLDGILGASTSHQDRLLDLETDVEPVLQAEMMRIAADPRSRSDLATVLNPPTTWADWRSYASAVTGRAEADLAAARAGLAGSSYKLALEILRGHREVLRSLVDSGRLSPASRARFFGPFAALANRCAIGPQKERIAETLALLRGGVVSMGPGPSPAIHSQDNGFLLHSTRLRAPAAIAVDHLIPAFTTWPVQNSAVEPVSFRLRSGSGPWYDRLPLDRDGVLLDQNGSRVPTIAVFGPPAEGASYYNHYVASPGTPSRALRDIDLFLAESLPDEPEMMLNSRQELH